MKEDDRLHLIHRYLSGVCTSEEYQTLEDWLEEDENHRTYFKAIKKVWKVAPTHDVDVNFEEEWKRISRRLGIELDEPGIKPNISKEDSSDTVKDNPLKYLLRVAAVILIIAVPAIYFADFDTESKVKSSQSNKVVMQKVETGRGERASMEFSDGTKIMLNSMSSVRFPKVFKGDSREIYLKGEAFFKVTHNDNMPFIVHSNGVAIRVLGTEFNVNTYTEDEAVEVVVREGKVAVTQNNLGNHKGRHKQSVAGDDDEPKRTVLLTKGQKTIVKSGALPSKPKKVSLLPYLAWIKGRMIFDGTPMREVIRRLRRAYHLNFEVQNSSLLSEQLKASFKRESPEKVVGIIAFSLGIGYEMHGDTVIFKSKNEGNTQ